MSIDPRRAISIDPNRTMSINPTRPMEIEGKYQFDIDRNPVEITATAHDIVLLVFDTNQKWKPFAATNIGRGFNQFDINENWVTF